MSHYPFPSFTYQMIARGKIVDSKTVTTAFDLNETEFKHRFTFLPNFDYAPKVKVIFYYVKDAFIVSESINVDLNQDFKNFIELDVLPNQATPGDAIDLIVKSNPNSYVGLLGVDKSVLILRGGNDLAHDEIWNELEMFHAQVKRRIYEFENSKKRKMPQYYNSWLDFEVSIKLN